MRVPITTIRDPGVSVGVTSVATESVKELNFSGTFQGLADSTLVVPTQGAATVGFHLEPPTNATVVFEGRWTPEQPGWSDATFRQMGADGYSTFATGHEDWIGSVSTFSQIRFRVTASGTGVGVVHGKFTDDVSVIEGVEHNNMPHRIGAAVQSKSFNIDKAAPNIALWQPASGKRVVVTDLHFTVAEVSTVVMFSDGSAAESPVPIFAGEFKPPSGQAVYVPISFSLPHVFSDTDRPLVFNQSSSAQVIGVIHGYESE